MIESKESNQNLQFDFNEPWIQLWTRDLTYPGLSSCKIKWGGLCTWALTEHSHVMSGSKNEIKLQLMRKQANKCLTCRFALCSLIELLTFDLSFLLCTTDWPTQCITIDAVDFFQYPTDRPTDRFSVPFVPVLFISWGKWSMLDLCSEGVVKKQQEIICNRKDWPSHF